MCDILRLRPFIDYQMQASTHPAPPQTALKPDQTEKHLLLSSPLSFMFAVQALICVGTPPLRWFPFALWVGMTTFVHA